MPLEVTTIMIGVKDHADSKKFYAEAIFVLLTDAQMLWCLKHPDEGGNR